jgi:putative hydrolase of the HAD superfamily
MSRGVDTVVFDLGGVVVRICRSFEQAAGRAGLPFDAARVQRAAAQAERKSLHALYERGRLSCDEFFARAAATTDGLYTPAEFRLIHERWIIEDYPGAAGLIDALHAAGLITGALSNTNASHWAQMSRVTPGTPALFDAPARLGLRHASHLLGSAKPDPAIYAAFVRLTGADPGRTVFFDDLPANVDAARAAGWHAHRIDPDADPPEQVRRLLREAHGVRV